MIVPILLRLTIFIEYFQLLITARVDRDCICKVSGRLDSVVKDLVSQHRGGVFTFATSWQGFSHDSSEGFVLALGRTLEYEGWMSFAFVEETGEVFSVVAAIRHDSLRRSQGHTGDGRDDTRKHTHVLPFGVTLV